MKRLARSLGKGLDFFLDTMIITLSGLFLLLLFIIGTKLALAGETEGLVPAFVALFAGSLCLLYSKKD